MTVHIVVSIMTSIYQIKRCFSWIVRKKNQTHTYRKLHDNIINFMDFFFLQINILFQGSLEFSSECTTIDEPFVLYNPHLERVTRNP